MTDDLARFADFMRDASDVNYLPTSTRRVVLALVAVAKAAQQGSVQMPEREHPRQIGGPDPVRCSFELWAADDLGYALDALAAALKEAQKDG